MAGLPITGQVLKGMNTQKVPMQRFHSLLPVGVDMSPSCTYAGQDTQSTANQANSVPEIPLGL